jgi:hypothetical protein
MLTHVTWNRRQRALSRWARSVIRKKQLRAEMNGRMAFEFLRNRLAPSLFFFKKALVVKRALTIRGKTPIFGTRRWSSPLNAR